MNLNPDQLAICFALTWDIDGRIRDVYDPEPLREWILEKIDAPELVAYVADPDKPGGVKRLDPTGIDLAALRAAVVAADGGTLWRALKEYEAAAPPPYGLGPSLPPRDDFWKKVVPRVRRRNRRAIADSRSVRKRFVVYLFHPTKPRR